MKKMLLTIVIALALLYSAYSLLTPRSDINIVESEIMYSLSASELFTAFSADELLSNEKYSSKILCVQGTLLSVNHGEEGTIQLWLDSGSDEGQVICNMSTLDSIALDKLKIGQELSIKGVCTGYLFDVVLDHAIVNIK